MAESATGSKNEDANGNAVMLADSRTASNSFGLTGSTFLNVPKTKFLFYVKFHRAEAVTSEWKRGVGTVVKNVDRPRVQFKTETLNQYNRKRVIQTTHEYEPIQFRFHDTVAEDVHKMFLDYYRYYYADSYLENAGTSVYDVVTGEAFGLGLWGLKPPMDPTNYGYFFSHISVYQLFGKQVSQFDLINPKIRDYNPDEFDSAANGAGEIQMSFEYENIIYHEPVVTPASLIQEMGLDRAAFWDVDTTEYGNAFYGLGKGYPGGDVVDAISNVLGQNLASLVTGQGTQSVGGMISSVAGQFDANRGLAVGKTAVTSLKNLVSGDTKSAKQGAQGLLKGVLFGSPGKFF